MTFLEFYLLSIPFALISTLILPIIFNHDPSELKFFGEIVKLDNLRQLWCPFTIWKLLIVLAGSLIPVGNFIILCVVLLCLFIAGILSLILVTFKNKSWKKISNIVLFDCKKKL